MGSCFGSIIPEAAGVWLRERCGGQEVKWHEAPDYSVVGRAGYRNGPPDVYVCLRSSVPVGGRAFDGSGGGLRRHSGLVDRSLVWFSAIRGSAWDFAAAV